MKTELLTILHHNRELVGDFYFPDNDTPSPLVIFSHGYNGSGKDFILNAIFCQNTTLPHSVTIFVVVQ